MMEVLVAAALVVVCWLVIRQLLTLGTHVAPKPPPARQAQVCAQEVMDKITDELRTAVVLPDPPQGGIDLFPVLWPPAQTPTGIIFPSGIRDFYERGREANRGGQFVRNRLVFTRPDVLMDDPADMNNWVYVEYLVPDDERNVLRRRVYPFDAAEPGHVFDLDHWSVDEAEFDGTGLSTDTDEDVEQELIAMPSPTDRVDFRVYNGVDTAAGSTYEFHPDLFEVEVSTFVGLERDNGDPNDDTNDQYRGVATLRSQVRLATTE